MWQLITNIKGKDGESGRDGDSVHADTIRLLVIEEVQKAVSLIPKPVNGKDGEHGRDAMQIDILPAIDSTKSFPRGTFARYLGGTIRAFRDTAPITDGLEKAGWEVVSDGFMPPEVEQCDDLRSFIFRFKQTSGTLTEYRFSMPVWIFRDFYKDGTEYHRGDVVASDNSSWHCQVESTQKRPGLSSDWRLVARKGIDGKEGKQGPEGKPGRDLTNNGARH